MGLFNAIVDLAHRIGCDDACFEELGPYSVPTGANRLEMRHIPIAL